MKDGDKGGGDKKDPPKEEPKTPAPAKELSLEKMTFTAAKGWEGQWNKALNDFPIEKYTPKPGGDINEASHIYISNLPDDVPLGVDDYAAKLSSDDKFQDMGYKYTKIAEKTKTADGWLIKGTVAATKPMDEEDKPLPGFVMMREIDGGRIRCRGSARSDALITEAVDLCKSIKLK